MDEVLQNHKKDMKILQCEIQRLKKSVPKGDKKRLKEVQLTIFNLEKDMTERHKKDIEILSLSSSIQCVDLESHQSSIKIQKSRKNKKKDNQKLYEDIIKRHEANEQNTDSYKEMECIKKKLLERNFEIIEIPPDGNCLFNAVGYQCIIHKIFDFSTEFSKNDDIAIHLRMLVYNEMMNKKDFYSPFISIEDSSEFDTYCELIRTTRAWGGQLEINALSEVLQCQIEVIQANVSSIIVGNSNLKTKLIITYHKFAFGLGEHYNTCDRCNSE